VPTAQESGVNYQVATWYGLWAPRSTPPEIVEAMQAALKKALNSDEIKSTWASLGAEPPNVWGDAFGKFLSSEIKRWGDVVKTSGAKLD
jgi:tripartite-type tricarboxylate transporter receptor subunit TctC